MIEKIVINLKDRKLVGLLHETSSSPFCVIASHGLFSSKDSEKFSEIAESFSAHGFNLLRFDHSGCGESSGRIEETTVTKRLEELTAFFQWTWNNLTKAIALLGSSMGAFISLVLACRDPRVMGAVGIATPAYFRGAKERLSNEDEPTLNEEFFIDAKRYNLLKEIKGLKNVFLIHGGKDELVPVEQAKEIYSLLEEPKKLLILPGGDHRLSDPSIRKQAIESSIDWFRLIFKKQ